MDDGRSRARPRFAPEKLWLICRLLIAALAISIAAPAAAQQARVTNLNNLGLGTASLTADTSKADDVCVYSTSSTKNYTVLATGDGSGGAFTLAAGAGRLAYEVEWAGSAAQTSGTALSSGTTSGTFNSTATASGCTSGPTTTASLIVRLRAAAVTAAPAGSYTGTLTITIAPQ